jgi:nucleotide-binding universal stress UspA family protein
MKKRFIVLVDFSEYSRNLVKFAGEWGKVLKAEILLLHQTDILIPALASSESRQQIVECANDDVLQKLKNLAQEILPDTNKVSFSVSENHLQISLPKLLSEPFQHLIFVGLKGTGIFKKIFIGSVALQVIENIKNIVVAIPKEIHTFSHKKVFIGVTDKHPLNVLELNNLLKFMDSANAELTFFSILKPNENAVQIEKQLRELTEMFKDKFKSNFVIYKGLDPFDEVKKVVRNKMIEMLVVQKGSRLLADQIFRSFLINELVYEGHTPLIVLP